MLKFIKNISDRLENMKLSTASWFIMFFSVSYLRNFLEGILERSRVIGVNLNAADSFRNVFLLFTLEWAALICVLVVILHIVTKTHVEKLFKITLVFFSVILIVPFIDYFAYYPAGSRVEYLYTISGFQKALAFFFYLPRDIGISLGVRIEVLISAVFAFLYVVSKTRSFLKAFTASVLLYFFAVSSMCFPVFITAPILLFKGAAADAYINSVFNTGVWPDSLAARTGIMISFVLVPFMLLCLYFHNKNRFLSFLRTAILNRTTAIYVSLIMCGFFAAARLPEMTITNKFFEQPFMPFYTAAAALLAVLASAAAGLLSVLDDKKTRESMPYNAALASIIALAAILSLCLSFHFFMAVLPVFLLAAMSYATPFKKMPEILKRAAASVSMFFLLFSGFVSVYGAPSPKIFSLTDTALYLSLLTSVQLSMGINKPIYALKTGISAFVLVSYLAFPLFYKDWTLMAVSIICGLISMLALNTSRLAKHRDSILVSTLSAFLISLCFLA